MFSHRSKIKNSQVTVTEANLNYIGSITIDMDLWMANIIANEKVSIVNNNNGDDSKLM